MRVVLNLCFFAGDVSRVGGQLAVARAFGAKSSKMQLSSEHDVTVEKKDEHTEFLVLANDEIWKVSFSTAIDLLCEIFA